MNYDLLLVDGPYLSKRSYEVPFRLKTTTNLDSTVIPTFLRSLLACYKQFHPQQTIITWESHGTPSWRRALNSDYKPKRVPDYNFINQVKDLQELLFLLGIQQFYSPTNEADDVIATLVAQTYQTPIETLIYSVDKDLMQLVGPTCHQWTGKELFDKSKVEIKFGIPPKLIPDLLALMGDASDNITGIKGFGEKKSSKLIAQYGLVERIGKELTTEQHIQVLRNKRLTTLNYNCELKELTFDTSRTIESILDKYELKKLKESISDYDVFKEKRSIDEYL